MSAAEQIIVIVGFMGCGKTAVARSLAAKLSARMMDLDEYIHETTGRTAAQIIRDDGEPAFRAIETDALAELLCSSNAGVISVGGGAWIQEANRTAISNANCLSVWLDAPFELCWKRIEKSPDDRPLGKSKEQARALFDRRRPVYATAMLHLKVEENETASDLSDRLTSIIAERLCLKNRN